MRSLRTSSPIMTIQPGVDFLQESARYLLSTHSDNLVNAYIITPNQRAAKGLIAALKQQSRQHALLMPYIVSSGHVQREDVLSLFQNVPAALSEILAIPPAMEDARRRSLFVKQIQAFSQHLSAFSYTPRALKLADSMMRMQDQLLLHSANIGQKSGKPIYIQNAGYQQVVQQLFTIILAHWPAICDDEGAISAIEFQLRLQQKFCQHLPEIAQDKPIYIIGSTGSIATTRALMQAVVRHPSGFVILPGADMHGQHHENAEIAFLHVNRAIQDMQAALSYDEALPQMARIVRISGKNAGLFEKVSATEIIARHSEEEAGAVALIVKEQLLTTPHQCLVIVPDKAMMRRIIQKLKAHGIVADCPPTQLLGDSELMRCYQAAMYIVANKQSAYAIRSLCDYLQATLPEDANSLQQAVYTLDKHALRKVNTHTTHQEISDDSAAIFLQAIEACITKLKHLFSSHFTASQWLQELQSAVQHPAFSPPTEFWEQLEAAVNSYASLGVLDVHEMLHLFHDIGQKTIANRQDTPHARVRILTPVEARLIYAECVIFTNFHHEYWPQISQQDGWINQQIKKTIGLPGVEEETALAAHDVWMHAHTAQHIYLSRAESDNGRITQPSPLRRFFHCQPALLDYPALYASLQKPIAFQPLLPSMPTPQKQARPEIVSVSNLNLLLKDPYSFYAKTILALDALQSYGEVAGKQDLGVVAHRLMQWVIEQENDISSLKLTDYIDRVLRQLQLGKAAQIFWKKQLSAIAEHALYLRKNYQENCVITHCEAAFESPILLDEQEVITLKGKVDMVETHQDGSLHVVDYKTGGYATAAQISKGQDAQLFGYALLLENADKRPKTLSYKKLPNVKKREEAVEITLCENEFFEKKLAFIDMLAQMRRADTPFLAHPLEEMNVDSHNSSYDGISRVEEWGN